MKNKEINEKIELARQSGYNEACYLNEKKLKEIEEELIEIINLWTNTINYKCCYNTLKQSEKLIKQIFAKHSLQFRKEGCNDVKLQTNSFLTDTLAKQGGTADNTPSGKYKGHTSADDTGGDNPVTAGDIGNGRIID